LEAALSSPLLRYSQQIKSAKRKMNKMAKDNRLKRSELFLLRMWTETTDTGSRLTHGKVQRAVSGQTTHFDDWQGLLDRLKAMVADDNDKDDKKQDPVQ
jgi:hypothetical protein